MADRHIFCISQINLNEMFRKFLYLCPVFLLCACDRVFEYHPYDLRLESKYKNINVKNIARLKEKDTGSDTVRFVFMGDSQRWYDETKDFVNHVNKLEKIDLVIHGGDISDFGMKKEYCWMHDILSKLKVPYVLIIGNHDNLGSGREVYKVMYGDLNFSFRYGNVKFVCLNTNALEFDYAVPVPDFKFLEREIADAQEGGYDKTIVAMHAQPGDVVFNNNVASPCQEYITRLKNLQFCFHAHAHSVMVNDFLDEVVLYYGCGSMKGRSYLLFTVTSDSYRYEVVHF